jgi:hypothetical protein
VIQPSRRLQEIPDLLEREVVILRYPVIGHADRGRPPLITWS